MSGGVGGQLRCILLKALLAVSQYKYPELERYRMIDSGADGEGGGSLSWQCFPASPPSRGGASPSVNRDNEEEDPGRSIPRTRARQAKRVTFVE